MAMKRVHLHGMMKRKKGRTTDGDVIHININMVIIQAGAKALFVIGDQVDAVVPEAHKV